MENSFHLVRVLEGGWSIWRHSKSFQPSISVLPLPSYLKVSFQHFYGNNTQVWYTFRTNQEDIVIESWSWKLTDRLSAGIVQGMATIGLGLNKMLWVKFGSFFSNQMLLFQLCLTVYFYSSKISCWFEKESEVPQSFSSYFRIFCQIQGEAV